MPARKPVAPGKPAVVKMPAKEEKKEVSKGAEMRAAIVATLKAIPYGHVINYGEVAARAGLPGYARYVCRVLRDLPDHDTPWWRVIRSDGRFGMDETTRGGQEQRRRLREEGLEFKGDRIVGPWW